MKIQGSYTPPMGQSAYSNLKQNISTPARQSGPEHTAQTMQKLAKPDQARLDAHQLINDMRIQASLKNRDEAIKSAQYHLVKAYQGFEAFKEQQMALNPDLDLSDLDVALKDGNIIMTGIKSQNGEPVTGNQINAIQEALSDNEELTKNLEYALSDLTKSVYTAGLYAEFRVDIEKLDSLEHNKEDLVQNGAFTINSFIEGFLDNFPRRPSHEDARETRKRELLGYAPVAQPQKEWDFSQALDDEYFESSFYHHLRLMGTIVKDDPRNHLAGTDAYQFVETKA